MRKAFFILLAVLSVSTLFAASKPKLPARFNKWLTQDVVYIISDQERKAFVGLGTDEQRDQFIEDFWEARNPIPGSPVNTYKNQIYERIAYASAHFGRMTNTPGWMTDMGRTWILFGKPESAIPFTGYGQIYPLELWFYSNKDSGPSLPAFFYILFFQPEGIEEYRFYHPSLDGPMKLVRGSQFNSNQDVYKFLRPLGGDLARSAFTFIPGDPIDTNTWRPDMSSELLISKIQNYANDRFNLDKLKQQRAMRTLISSHLILSRRSLATSDVVFTDAMNQTWLDYAVTVDDEQMGTRTPDGKFLVDFRYRLLTDKGQLIAEDQEQSKYDAYEVGSGFHPFDLAGRLPLISGHYRLQVEVVSASSGKTFTAENTVETSSLTGTWLSRPLLSDTATQALRPDAITPFQYYGAQFRPLVRNQISNHQILRILYQVHVASPGDYQVSYVLANLQNREARKVIAEPIPASSFREQLLLKTKSIPLADFPPGEYMLAIQLKTPSGDVIASLNHPIHIQEGLSSGELHFLANSRSMSSVAVQDYFKGLEALAGQNDIAAETYLEKSSEENPANSFAKQFLVELYFHQRNYGAIAALYRKSVIADFKASPQILAQISFGLWRSGSKQEASSLLKQAELLFPNNQLLAATQKSLANDTLTK